VPCRCADRPVAQRLTEFDPQAVDAYWHAVNDIPVGVLDIYPRVLFDPLTGDELWVFDFPGAPVSARMRVGSGGPEWRAVLVAYAEARRTQRPVSLHYPTPMGRVMERAR
jgi:hypothetical protein